MNGRPYFVAFPRGGIDVGRGDVLDVRERIDALGQVGEQSGRGPVRHEHDVRGEEVGQLAGARGRADRGLVLVGRDDPSARPGSGASRCMRRRSATTRAWVAARVHIVSVVPSSTPCSSCAAVAERERDRQERRGQRRSSVDRPPRGPHRRGMRHVVSSSNILLVIVRASAHVCRRRSGPPLGDAVAGSPGPSARHGRNRVYAHDCCSVNATPRAPPGALRARACGLSYGANARPATRATPEVIERRAPPEDRR